MGPLVGETKLRDALIQAGKDLLQPHSTTDAIFNLLNKLESLLLAVEQDPIVEVKNALKPSMQALVSADLLRNPDSDVRVYVVSCLTEIMRITAPEAPYNDDQMKEVFEVTVEAFGKLADASCDSYKKAEAVLDTVAKVRSSLVMLDLECDDLILEMFRQFLKIIRLSPDCPQPVLLSMETIMVTVIDESEEVSLGLLEILLGPVKKESQDVSPVASRLVEKVLINCACKLRPDIMEALKSTGTSLDIYSPVVSSICQSKSATTEARMVVNPKEIEADEKIEGQVVPSDSLQEKMDLGPSPKGTRSKRTSRGGARAKGNGNVQNGDGDTESGSTRRRKPNSLINPEEGYSFKTSSSKKVHEKELGDSALGKVAAKKTSLPSKVGQTNQSVVISLSPSSKARKGSRKRSRSNMEETNPNEVSLATTATKKQIVQKVVPVDKEDLMESDLEKPEDSTKTAKSSKKESAQKGTGKTTAKKPFEKSVNSDAKKKNSKGARMDKQIPLSSKSKKNNSRCTAPSTKESEHTPKSHPKRKRTDGEEVDSNESELGKELVGKRVKVWWPLDKKFYEGVIDSYCSRKKIHQVFYSDGDVEELTLKEERWEIIQDNPSSREEMEIDLPDSTPLSDILRRQKAKKSKNVSMNVELDNSSDFWSSKKEDSVTNSTKQGKRIKGTLKGVSKEAGSREKPNLKSSKEPDAETGRAKGMTEERQKVTGAINQESEKGCDDKVESETKGEDSLKIGKDSNAESECKKDDQELPEDVNTEIKVDGEELKFTNKSTAELETDGDEQVAAKEATAELKTDREEPESVEEPNEEQTEVQVRESAKEPSADTKLIEEDMSEENGKVANEAEEDDQRTVKELEEETDKVAVVTVPV